MFENYGTRDRIITNCRYVYFAGFFSLRKDEKLIFLIKKVLLDDIGLAYVCQTYERFSHVAMVLVGC